jgi:hypothetical protein
MFVEAGPYFVCSYSAKKNFSKPGIEVMMSKLYLEFGQ